jgi:hypothetical protein
MTKKIKSNRENVIEEVVQESKIPSNRRKTLKTLPIMVPSDLFQNNTEIDNYIDILNKSPRKNSKKQGKKSIKKNKSPQTKQKTIRSTNNKKSPNSKKSPINQIEDKYDINKSPKPKPKVIVLSKEDYDINKSPPSRTKIIPVAKPKQKITPKRQKSILEFEEDVEVNLPDKFFDMNLSPIKKSKKGEVIPVLLSINKNKPERINIGITEQNEITNNMNMMNEMKELKGKKLRQRKKKNQKYINNVPNLKEDVSKEIYTQNFDVFQNKLQSILDRIDMKKDILRKQLSNIKRLNNDKDFNSIVSQRINDKILSLKNIKI